MISSDMTAGKHRHHRSASRLESRWKHVALHHTAPRLGDTPCPLGRLISRSPETGVTPTDHRWSPRLTTGGHAPRRTAR